MKRIGLALVIAVLLLAGCGGGSGSTSGGSSEASGGGRAKAVTISEFTFEPAQLTVPVGTTVTFTNRDPTPHTATSKTSGAFETGAIKQGESAQITLSEPGTYSYYCAFHPFMKGTITVE
jgi:plastocyanin